MDSDRKKKLKLLIIPLLLLLLIAALYYAVTSGRSNKLEYSGVVEATTYDLAFEISGKISEYHVKEGDTVKKGDLLVSLDDETIRANLEAAEARLGQARFNLNNLVAGARPQEIQQAVDNLEGARADLKRLQNGPTVHELQQARAAMQAAYEQYQNAQTGYRTEDIRSARENMRAAQSTLSFARDDFERYQKLYQQGAVSAQTFEAQRNKYDTARAAYNTALNNYQKLQRGLKPQEVQAALDQYRAARAAYENLAAGTRPELIEKARTTVRYWENQVSLLKAGPRINDVKTAEKRVSEAEAAVSLARIQLKNSKITAPSAGVIVTKNFENREIIAAGTPVVSMIDLANPWVYIFIPETELGLVKLGAPATVTVDSFPGRKFKGRVSRIYENAEFTPKFIQTKKERVNLVFRTKVAVENSELVLKPGMPADVVVEKVAPKKK